MAGSKSQRPLLYINQPFSRPPSTNMQDVYSNKYEGGETEEENLVKQKKQKSHGKEPEQMAEPIPIDVPKEAKSQDVKQQPSFNRVKSFKEMDLNERLDYLLHFPKALPPVPCVFYTDNQNFQGYLQDYKDGQITIQFHDETTRTLAVQDLKNVLMIGINK